MDSPAVGDVVVGGGGFDNVVIGGGGFDAATTMGTGNNTIGTLPSSPPPLRQDGEAVCNVSAPAVAAATCTTNTVMSKPPSTPTRPQEEIGDADPTPRRSPRKHQTSVNPPVISNTKCRTIAEINTEREKRLNGVQLPAWLVDIGVFRTFEELYSQVEMRAKDPSIGGGAFSVRRDSTTPATSRRGKTQQIACSSVGKPTTKQLTEMTRPNQKESVKTDCKWVIGTEESTEGWVITYPPPDSIKHAVTNFPNKFECVCHNHQLKTNQVEIMMDPKLRSIPDNLRALANTLHEKAGLSASKIYFALVRECREQGIDVTFSQEDVRNLNPAKAGDKILDCTYLVKHLKERLEEDEELEYDVQYGDDGAPETVFLVIKGGQEVWSNIDSQVILYDTKHGTNRYGMKLGCFVSIDSTGRTRILAASFVSAEDAESFTWAFHKFLERFGRPRVLFTDSDPAMALAQKNVWPLTTHLLCTFHIWKNFWQHIHPLFLTNDAAWREVAGMWWKLCKLSDVSEQVTFDDKFDKLVELISRTATVSEDKIRDRDEWLQSLKLRKKQWAACYTSKHFTAGIASTARAEAMHSAISQFSNKCRSILDIVLDLEQMAEGQQFKSKMATVDVMLRSAIHQLNLPPGFESIQLKIGSYARMIMNAQIGQILQYHCARDNGGGSGSPTTDTQFVVTRSGILPASVDLSKPNEIQRSDYDQLELATDHGVDKYSIQGGSQHITSVSDCTCQFHKKFGIPCRHQLSVMFNIGGTVLMEESVVSCYI